MYFKLPIEGFRGYDIYLCVYIYIYILIHTSLYLNSDSKMVGMLHAGGGPYAIFGHLSAPEVKGRGLIALI